MDGGFGINTKDEMLFEMLFVDKSKYDCVEAWERLQQISEMTEREFNASCGKEVGWTSDEESENAEDGVGDEEEDFTDVGEDAEE